MMFVWSHTCLELLFTHEGTAQPNRDVLYRTDTTYYETGSRKPRSKEERRLVLEQLKGIFVDKKELQIDSLAMPLRTRGRSSSEGNQSGKKVSTNMRGSSVGSATFPHVYRGSTLVTDRP